MCVGRGPGPGVVSVWWGPTTDGVVGGVLGGVGPLLALGTLRLLPLQALATVVVDGTVLPREASRELLQLDAKVVRVVGSPGVQGPPAPGPSSFPVALPSDPSVFGVSRRPPLGTSPLGGTGNTVRVPIRSLVLSLTGGAGNDPKGTLTSDQPSSVTIPRLSPTCGGHRSRPLP